MISKGRGLFVVNNRVTAVRQNNVLVGRKFRSESVYIFFVPCQFQYLEVVNQGRNEWEEW